MPARGRRYPLKALVTLCLTGVVACAEDVAPKKGLSHVIDYLKRTERSSDDDAFLEHAAQVGMLPARL